jgi:hypothetical protein
MKRSAIFGLAVAGVLIGSATAAVIGFEEIPLGGSNGPTGVWNGQDGSGSISTGGASFNNYYTDWGGGFYSWSGIAFSNTTDTTNADYSNQYSSVTGSGDDSATYGVAYFSEYEIGNGANPPTITFDQVTDLTGLGISITNTYWAAQSMLQGDAALGSGPGKKFGGESGTDADWFKLIITGLDEDNHSTGSQEFYLADYRGEDDYVITDWTFVDLSALGDVKSLVFTMESSDTGAFGINTPAYFAFDNVLAVPEPSALLMTFAGLGIFLRRKRA